jgi:ABC-type bacteriocin/lantibiotic exporter with double-glycine peptidase domain
LTPSADIAGAVRRFLAGAISLAPTTGIGAPPPPDQTMSDWCAFLERHLDLVAMPIGEGSDIRQLDLALASHEEYGPILIRTKHSIVLRSRITALTLRTGLSRSLREDELPRLAEVKVLLQPIPESAIAGDDASSADGIGRLLLYPTRSLSRQLFLVQLVTGVLNSALFIINITVLAQLVPTQSEAAFAPVSLLFGGVLLTILLVTIVSVRLTTRLQCLSAQREEVAKLSLLSIVRPAFLAEFGTERVLQACSALVSVARARADAIRLFAPLVILVPVLLLTFLRLPALLFVLTLAMALLSMAVRLGLEGRLRAARRELAIEEERSETALHRIVSNVVALRTRRCTDRVLAAWRDNRTRCEMLHYAAGRDERLIETAQVAFEALCSVLVFGSISLSLSLSHDVGAPITVGLAFIVTSLVTRTFQLVPNVSSAVAALVGAKLGEDACRLLEEIRAACRPRERRVTRAHTSVAWTDLRLRPGCDFGIEAQRTMSIDGAAVIRIAGDSGAGKSTLLRCLCGLQSPAAGSIRVLGVDPLGLTRGERRRLFGYVDHAAQLLPGTLRDNLRLFNAEANDRQLWEALERARIGDCVNAMPMALDTPVHHAYRTFSTGERQRFVLAQTLLKTSSILLLDEAMSGVSETMESEILSSLRRVAHQIYLVTHRETSQQQADVTILLEQSP